jgi:hypothetical protein
MILTENSGPAFIFNKKNHLKSHPTVPMAKAKAKAKAK